MTQRHLLSFESPWPHFALNVGYIASQRLLITILAACVALVLPCGAQNTAPADRNAVNTTTRPGGMAADSPVTFPKEGAIFAGGFLVSAAIAQDRHPIPTEHPRLLGSRVITISYEHYSVILALL